MAESNIQHLREERSELGNTCFLGVTVSKNTVRDQYTSFEESVSVIQQFLLQI